MNLLLFRLAFGATLALLAIFAQGADDQHPVGRFEIARFEVRGNTLLPISVVEKIVSPFTGKQRDFGHVHMALEALQAAHHERGFRVIEVALPEQEWNHGVVVLQVLEARVAKVHVKGNRNFSGANIRRSVPGLVRGQPPNSADISASLKWANENLAKKITLQLQPGSADGEVDAVLVMSGEKPSKIATTLDDSGNSSIGDTRLTVQYQHANVADLDHVLSLQYSTTLEKLQQIAAYGVGYHIPLVALGDSIDLFASYSNADFNLDGSSLSVAGKGTVLGSRYNYHLRRVGGYASSLSYGIDRKTHRNTLQSAQSGVVTVHRLGLAYSGTWTQTDAEVSFGLSAIGNISGGSRGRPADFHAARTGAEPDFRIFRYNVVYSRALPQDWQMRVGLRGQRTPDALIPGEQLVIGGTASVRGFDELDVAIDEGHQFNAEIYTPNFCGGIKSAAVECRAVGFYDAAFVQSNNVQPGEMARASPASVGLGLRVSVDKRVTLQMDYGHRMNSDSGSVEGGERLHVRLGLSY